MHGIKNKKRAQKEKLILREVARLYAQTSADDAELKGLFINRVEMSDDKSICDVYFFAEDGKAFFDARLDRLRLYKPSLRKALADELQFRYVPDLRFRFDSQFEKQRSIELLLDKIKKEEDVTE
jgi:ribosome-binding factor A